MTNVNYLGYIMVTKRRHPIKELERVIVFATRSGWKIILSKKGHIYGTLYCPSDNCANMYDSCARIIRIPSTAKNSESIANNISKKIDNCPTIETV